MLDWMAKWLTKWLQFIYHLVQLLHLSVLITWIRRCVPLMEGLRLSHGLRCSWRLNKLEIIIIKVLPERIIIFNVFLILENFFDCTFILNIFCKFRNVFLQLTHDSLWPWTHLWHLDIDCRFIQIRSILEQVSFHPTTEISIDFLTNLRVLSLKFFREEPRHKCQHRWHML